MFGTDVDPAVLFEQFDVADGALGETSFTIKHSNDLAGANPMHLAEREEQRCHVAVITARAALTWLPGSAWFTTPAFGATAFPWLFAVLGNFTEFATAGLAQHRE